MKKKIASAISVMMVAMLMVVYTAAAAGASDGNQAQNGKTITFYLVRHGETVFNTQKRLQGYSDSPLTEEGIKVAENLGRGLKDIPFNAAYSSTSERASDTANLILKGRYIPITKDKRLKEINFGSWEGEYTDDILKQHPDFYDSPDLYKTVGGESYEELYKRTEAAMNRIVEENKAKGGNVLVVSHGLTILNYVTALDPNSWDWNKGGLPNSSVTKVQWKDGKFKVLTVGDPSYAEKGEMKLTFYLVRHGETIFNVQDRMQGYSDSPLTEKGIKVAENLGRGLKDIPFSAAYSSTSERAVDTADIILDGRNLPLKTDKRLKEMNFGDWEGEFTSDILKQHPDFYDSPDLLKTVGGESYAELLKRTEAAMNRIVEENKGKSGNILVVSHGLTILNYVTALDPNSWDWDKGGLPNSSVTTIEWQDGKFKVLTVGDPSYAKKGEKSVKL
ncbi:histidine phosphatase family protein [Paenibacillus sp. GCM10027629]|uniref:histidine phosphatase family protein n=1 Tax=Paenibacillus sp. GCM10027629 TaxID=3273414 RepID=UPI00363DBEE4